MKEKNTVKSSLLLYSNKNINKSKPKLFNLNFEKIQNNAKNIINNSNNLNNKHNIPLSLSKENKIILLHNKKQSGVSLKQVNQLDFLSPIHKENKNSSHNIFLDSKNNNINPQISFSDKNLTEAKLNYNKSNSDSINIESEETKDNIISNKNSIKNSSYNSKKNILDYRNRIDSQQNSFTESNRVSLNDSIRKGYNASPKLMKNHPELKLFFDLKE